MLPQDDGFGALPVPGQTRCGEERGLFLGWECHGIRTTSVAGSQRHTGDSRACPAVSSKLAAGGAGPDQLRQPSAAAGGHGRQAMADSQTGSVFPNVRPTEGNRP